MRRNEINFNAKIISKIINEERKKKFHSFWYLKKIFII